MWMVQLALRNLTRNLRRTALSMAAVVAGVAVLILGQGFIGGLEEGIIRGEVDSMSAHVLVRPADYPTTAMTHPIDHLLTVDAPLATWLDANSQAWTTRLMFTPRAIHGPDAIRVRGVVFDPERDPKVFPRDTWRVDGDVPKGADDGVLVSSGVARILDLKKGDVFVLESRTPAGAINALETHVAGVFTSGNPALDRFAVFVPSPFGQQLLQSGDLVSHVLVRLPDRDGAEAFADQLRTRAPAGGEVTTWVEETHDMLETQKIRRKALDFLVFVLMGMSATSIANTVLMAAYERIREVGTLRAMGMTRGGVVGMFLLEGGFMGLVGAGLGALIGGGVIGFYARNGIDLSSAMDAGAGGDVAIAAMLYTQWSTGVVVGAVVFGALVAVLASVYPARVASGMAPAEAVRAE